MGWYTMTLYKCIAHTDRDYIESTLTEDEEYPEPDDILIFMRDYVMQYTTVTPYEEDELEEYEIPGKWIATDGKLDLYSNGEDYYLMSSNQVMVRDLN